MKFIVTIALMVFTTIISRSPFSRTRLGIEKITASDTTVIVDEGYRIVTTNYENGKKNGKEVIVLKNGDTSEIWTFKDDSLDGQEISYYPHNKVGIIGYYKGNVKIGNWKAFDTSGNLNTEAFFNGKGLWPAKENFYSGNKAIFTQIWENGRRTKIVIHDQPLYNEYKLTDMSLGHKIFNETCAACHSLKTKIIGPPLGGITQIRDRKWLLGFIRNANKMIKNNDPLSNRIYNEYEKIEHPNYSYLTPSDVEAVLDYIENKK